MSKKISIASDAMGGDNSPDKTIEGVKIFIEKNKNNKDFILNLFGKENLINKKIEEYKISSDLINIINNSLTNNNATLVSSNPIKNPYTNNKFSKLSNHRLNLLSNMLTGSTTFAGGALGFNLAEINKLTTRDISVESGLIRFADHLWDDYFNSNDAKLSKWMTLIDLKVRLPELLLMRMDKLVMQSGVEARVPFLDHKLVEFVLTIPEVLLNTDY